MDHLVGCHFQQKLYFSCFRKEIGGSIIQHLLLHDIIIKPLLDHFSSGLKILGFKNAIKSDTEIFRNLFLLNSSLDAQTVMQPIEYEETEFVNKYRYFEQYVL